VGLSLYEINEQIAKFQYDFDEETGEILNADALDVLELARDEKIESLCLYSKSLRAEAKAVGDEEKNLSDRKKGLLKKADGIDRYIEANLNGKPFKTARVVVNWRQSQAVIIPDDRLVPDRFTNCTVVRKPDKAVIKAYLKKAKETGEQVDWAILEERNNMSIK